MLAIVAPSFNQVSETFVADHARALRPGRTVLVCGDSRGAERFGRPVLSHVSPLPAAFGPAGRLRRRARAAGAARLRLRLDAVVRCPQPGGRVPPHPGGDRGAGRVRQPGVLVSDPCRLLGCRFTSASAATTPPRRCAGRRCAASTAGCSHGRRIIAESRYLADRLVEIGCPEARLHVNPSGADPEQYQPGRPEPGRILAIGRLVEMKAPQLTLAAFARSPGASRRRISTWSGRGPLQAACEAVIREHGLEARVTLHRAQSHDACAALSGRAAMFVQHSVDHLRPARRRAFRWRSPRRWRRSCR